MTIATPISTKTNVDNHIRRTSVTFRTVAWEFDPCHYAWRSATRGSTRVAQRAGT